MFLYYLSIKSIILWLCISMCVTVHVWAYTLWIPLSASLICKGNTADCNLTRLLGDYFTWCFRIILNPPSLCTHSPHNYLLSANFVLKAKMLNITENVQPSSWRLFSDPQTLWICCSEDKCQPVQLSASGVQEVTEARGTYCWGNNDLLSVDRGAQGWALGGAKFWEMSWKSRAGQVVNNLLI